eukprot:TRINITY_DN1041_c0_g1_i1.p2 TRINITY_DN1041_c0_g1~~TRINITY_DN1041_c0_g1_i1.p2  ORF type:complete len:212 (-),score=42.56 TRINITY_DN1041_c0_g1_i1:370-1005(-)
MQQQQCQVAIPEGVNPGGQFIANTPDGQQVQITAPSDSAPGQLVAFNYMPVGMAPPTVVGQPVGAAGGYGGYGGGGGGYGYGGDDYMDAPPLYAMETADEARRRQDKVGSEVGWIMYFIGWALCCCCGPIGPIFWLGVACMHWAKPKEQRELLRQERAVAVTSLATSVLCIFMTLVFMMMLTLSSGGRDTEPGYEGQQTTEGMNNNESGNY